MSRQRDIEIQYSDLIEPVDLVIIDSKSLDEHSIEILKDAYDRNPKMHHALMSASRSRADVLNCLSAGFTDICISFSPTTN